MKKFVDKPKIKPSMRETSKAINDGMKKITEVGIVYYTALAKMRARLDAKRGNHELADRSIPDEYMPYYRSEYDKTWNMIREDQGLSGHENGQKNSNS